MKTKKIKFSLTIMAALVMTIKGAEPLPRAAQELVAKRQEAVSRIDKRLIEELEKVKTSSMKSGDLDGANAVQALIKDKEKLQGANPAVGPAVSWIGVTNLPIRLRPGLKLLWCPDAHRSAYFILEEGGKIRSLDEKTWQGSTDDWKWESSTPGKITLSFSDANTTLIQRKDSQMFEGSDPSKKNARVRLVVVGFEGNK